MAFDINSPILYLLAGIIILVVLAQSVFFLVKAWKRGIAIGMDKTKLRRIATTAAIPALNSGTVGIMVPVSVVFTLIVSRIMYKKGMLD